MSPIDSTDNYHRARGGFDRIPKYDPRSAEHLWIVATLYRVVPPDSREDAGPTYLDSENLVHVSPVGCYHCEQAYAPNLRRRRCPGRGPE